MGLLRGWSIIMLVVFCFIMFIMFFCAVLTLLPGAGGEEGPGAEAGLGRAGARASLPEGSGAAIMSKSLGFCTMVLSK